MHPMFRKGSVGAAFFAALAGVVWSPAIAENVGTVTGGGLVGQKPLIAVVAADERGSMGYAVGYPMDQSERARADALKGCVQADCKIVLYANAFCIAASDAKRSDGAYWYWYAYGSQRDEVRSKVMSWCRDSADANAAGCTLRFAECQD